MNYINESLERLKRYCENNDFKGWDPYDGLNSRVFSLLPFKCFKIARIYWIQLLKRSPFNLRRLFFVEKGYNPKALSLFISGYVNLYNTYKKPEHKEKIIYLADKLFDMRSRGFSSHCWGYNFDWQSRAFFIPKFTPNVIVSTFAANALLDIYELIGGDRYLKAAQETADFIRNNLNKSPGKEGGFCFSYSPLDNSRIFNASLLASKFLSRIYAFTNDKSLLDDAKRSIEFCCRQQNEDGSWFYGMETNQRWIDSFHTGYNLEAIYEYQKYSNDKAYEGVFKRGLKYYLSTFFSKEGILRYYNNSTYPIDTHCTAQLIVLLSKAGILKENLSLAQKTLAWTIANMQDERGYFYYQSKRFYKIRIPYIRWSCAWMFYALSHFVLSERKA